MVNFLKTLLWQPPWRPLGLVMAIGLLIGMSEPKADDELELPEKFWPRDIIYYIHSSCDDETQERIQLAAIEAANYSVQIVHGGTFNNFGRDNRNTIGCAQYTPFVDALMLPSENGLVYEDQQLVMMTDGELFVLGTTRTWHYPDTGEIVEFDIWLNELWMLVERIAWHTMRHEWGHALGLPHSRYGESLMAPSDGSTNWDIGTIATLALIYGRCEARVDNNLNLWLPSITVLDPNTKKMRDVYAVIPSGAEWPTGVFWYGEALCGK